MVGRWTEPPPEEMTVARARLRPCAEPGCPLVQPEPRCPDHRREVERYRAATTPTKATRTAAERRRRAAAVAEHRARHGDWCPGWRRAPHEATDLTADHVQSIASGGRPDGPLSVLCRACNSAKGAKTL